MDVSATLGHSFCVDLEKLSVNPQMEQRRAQMLAWQAFQLDDTNNALQPKLSWRGNLMLLEVKRVIHVAMLFDFHLAPVRLCSNNPSGRMFLSGAFWVTKDWYSF